MSIPARVNPETSVRLAERTLVAMQPLDSNHPTCAAGHTPADHETICLNCWKSKKTVRIVQQSKYLSSDGKEHPIPILSKLKDDTWQGQMGCPMYQALVVDNLMPLDTKGLDDDTIHQMQADHERNYKGCDLMTCGLERYTKDLITDWNYFGKQVSLAMADHERKQAHDLGEPRQIRRGRFGTIGKEVFFDNQILYRVMGIGMGLNGKPFAKVKMANSDVILLVELGDTLRGLSRNAKKKAVRYGKKTVSYMLAVGRVCHKAVEHHLSH